MTASIGQPKQGYGFTGGPAAYQSQPGDGIGDATQQYPLGTVSWYENTDYGNNGRGSIGACIYLQFTQSGVTLTSPSLVTADPSTDLYAVTMDLSDNTAGPYAISCSVLTDAYFGWFWFKGVPPLFYTDATTKFSAGTITTDGNIAADSQIAAHTGDGAIAVYTWSTTASSPIGYSAAADTSTSLAISNIRLYGFGW